MRHHLQILWRFAGILQPRTMSLWKFDRLLQSVCETAQFGCSLYCRITGAMMSLVDGGGGGLMMTSLGTFAEKQGCYFLPSF